MCKAPVLILNPNYNSPVKDPKYHLLNDTKSPYLAVPCGRCQTCIHLRQIYLVQRVQMEALNNDLFYGTLTFNQSSLSIAKFGDIKFAYTDISDWQKMIKMIRKDYPNLKFKYLFVTEYGGKRHRPHIHFLLSLPRSGVSLAEKHGRADMLFHIFLSYWRRNYGDNWNPIWKPLCTYVRRGNKYNYDLHYLDPYSSKDGLDGVSFYVTKYILKYDEFVEKFKRLLYCRLDHSDYRDAWNLFRPRCLLSKGFGSPRAKNVIEHIFSGINFAIENNAFYPYFISRVNGSTYPLAPYYQKRYLTVEQKLFFISRRPDTILTDVDIQQFDNSQFKLGQMIAYLSNQSLLVDFDDIDDINSKLIDDAEFSRLSQQTQDFADDWQNFEFSGNTDFFDSDDVF